jgi:hypothetical protein
MVITAAALSTIRVVESGGVVAFEASPKQSIVKK